MAQQRPISGHSCQMTKISGQLWNFRKFRTTGTHAISTCPFESVRGEIFCIALMPFQSSSYATVGITHKTHIFCINAIFVILCSRLQFSNKFRFVHTTDTGCDACRTFRSSRHFRRWTFLSYALRPCVGIPRRRTGMASAMNSIPAAWPQQHRPLAYP